ncbi:hypothetical protein ACLMJK_004948 [Lecanora helva]
MSLTNPVPYNKDLLETLNSSHPIQAGNHRGNQTGDTLAITRCYCASKNWENNDLFGYYYLWDYYNIHANSRVKLERTCHRTEWTRGGILGSWRIAFVCLRFKPGEEECAKDPAGNKFCYHYQGKEKFDFFTWNHQTRKIPLDSPVAIHDTEAQVYDKCQALCHDKVGNGDMQMLTGRSLVYANQNTPNRDKFGPWDNEWSHISYYPEIDDMCHGCK